MSKNFSTNENNKNGYVNPKIGTSVLNSQDSHAQNTSHESIPIAIDTNVFIDLLCVFGKGQRRKAGTCFTARLKDLLSLAQSGKVTFVITPTVFYELTNGHHSSKKEIEFLQKYCRILSPKNPLKFAENTVKLSSAYCENGVMDYVNGGVSNDALIMAECSLAGINLLTNNYRDFVIYNSEKQNYMHDSYGDIIPKQGYNDRKFESIPKNGDSDDLKKALKYKGRFRALDIAQFNESFGLTRKYGDFTMTPMPFTTIDFVGKTSAKEGFMNSRQFKPQLSPNDFSLETYENSMQ